MFMYIASDVTSPGGSLRLGELTIFNDEIMNWETYKSSFLFRLNYINNANTTITTSDVVLFIFESDFNIVGPGFTLSFEG